MRIYIYIYMCILGGYAARCFCRPLRYFILFSFRFRFSSRCLAGATFHFVAVFFSGRAFWVGTLPAVFAGRRDFSLCCPFFWAVHSGWVRCPLFLPAAAKFHFVFISVSFFVPLLGRRHFPLCCRFFSGQAFCVGTLPAAFARCVMLLFFCFLVVRDPE